MISYNCKRGNNRKEDIKMKNLTNSQIRTRKRHAKAFMRKLVIIGLFMLALGYADFYGNTYKVNAEVVAVSDEVVTFEDARGYLWETNNDGYEEGQKFSLTMFMNDTNTVKDDKIMSVRGI